MDSVPTTPEPGVRARRWLERVAVGGGLVGAALFFGSGSAGAQATPPPPPPPVAPLQSLTDAIVPLVESLPVVGPPVADVVAPVVAPVVATVEPVVATVDSTIGVVVAAAAPLVPPTTVVPAVLQPPVGPAIDPIAPTAAPAAPVPAIPTSAVPAPSAAASATPTMGLTGLPPAGPVVVTEHAVGGDAEFTAPGGVPSGAPTLGAHHDGPSFPLAPAPAPAGAAGAGSAPSGSTPGQGAAHPTDGVLATSPHVVPTSSVRFGLSADRAPSGPSDRPPIAPD